MFNLSELRVEDQLLLACARSEIDGATVARIEGLAPRVTDWDNFLDRALFHRVVPLVQRTLARLGGAMFPADLLGQIAQDGAAITGRNLFLTAELIRISDWLRTEGIDAIPYKGPPLAGMAYGSFSLRQFGDLDLLVRPGDYDRTREVFLAQGWRIAADYEWECTFRDEPRAIDVDVHRALAPERFPLGSGLGGFWARVEPVAIAGGRIRTVCVEDMLFILCTQLIKDAWGARVLRLSKLCDIAELLRAFPQMDFDRVRRNARRAGCLRMLGVAFTFAQELLGAPAPWSCTAPRGGNIGLVERHVFSRLFDHADHPVPTELSRERFHFLVRERWRDKFYPTYCDLKGRLPPNELDFAVVALPERLRFLYYVIRPFRVASDWLRVAYRWARSVLTPSSQTQRDPVFRKRDG
jgi:hypothetical protein